MHITSAESHVMEALWRREPLTADELVAEVGTSQSWGEATVKTLINRLLKKKAIKSERAEGKHGYRPMIARSVYVQAESQGLLDRLFEGQLAPMISHFAQHRALKAEEIARLKRLIEELEDGS
ncbi:BlaI/MecI/CopY family transcriptional regulator [Caulobacter henricii]|uniref:BlaI/MecI/CopY family transcriptional regulator n=1 Tax=Caulobacter henricii TaxID=69395 RepID=A0A0P0NZD0_9CAUL|nr:BlaI/MecI/CopY family transcriptional regulator [Caulobacter henricii]ALL13223.1 BlaI/MecI/CopY family transcriptional regulator [Caulobacter henricii]